MNQIFSKAPLANKTKPNTNPIQKANTLPFPEYSAVIIIFLMMAINMTVPSIDIKYTNSND